MRTLKRLVACAVLAWAPAVFAFSIVEIGDAGDLPGTAQATTGTGDLLSIAGAIGDGASDLDAAAHSLNNRPRETLAWHKPSEKLTELLVAHTT